MLKTLADYLIEVEVFPQQRYLPRHVDWKQRRSLDSLHTGTRIWTPDKFFILKTNAGV